MTNNLEGGKSLLTRIKNNTDVSKHLIDLLYKKPDLSFNEAEFLFSVALLLIEEYQETIDQDKYLLIEYAYLIIAVTCFKTNDFRALYDFSVNYGYYPTARTILESGLIKDEELTINHLISDLGIDKFVDENKVKTYEQNKVFEEILDSNFKQLSFIAPTSYGKSELVFQHIKKNNECNFIAIIVPTKALIDQTFRAAKRNISDRKIIVHDQNYDSEKDARVLAIVTQERGLRLIEEGMVFDLIYIDEAHELLDFNFSNLFSNRSLLLSRFIKLSIMRKPELKIIYLSPSIQNSKNLSLRNQGEIQSYRIEKNLKILKIRYLNRSCEEYIYDLFFNEFIPTAQIVPSSFDYITKVSISFRKNLHFLYRPRMIENYTEKLYSALPEESIPDEIEDLQRELATIIHPKFKLIKYLSKGIVYMHGRMPLLIRNYLLKFIRESDFLQNFVANAVVLAGMNLPIDNLIYISGFKSISDLNNLIGRVNRLNEIFKDGDSLSRLFIPVHFVDIEEYPQYSGTKNSLKTKIEQLRGRHLEDVKNPLLEEYNKTKNAEKATEIRSLENQVIENYNNPDFFTRLTKAGAQQILNYTADGLQQLENILINEEKIIGTENLIELILNKVKKVFFDSFLLSNIFLNSSLEIDTNLFNPGNNVKRLRYDATIDYYRRFLEFSFNGLNERIEDLYKYWTDDILGNSSRKDLNYYIYVGRQFGEVAYYETESHQGQKVYVDLRTHKYDENYLYNLAVIKIQTDEDFINHEITLLLSTLKEFEIITENQFNYFLYGTFDKKEIEVLRLGISRNIYQSLKANNQIENISFDEFGNAYANEYLKSYIDKKTGIEKFELEQFFL